MNIKTSQISPLGVYEEGMPWNAVEKTIMERRSIRGFKKEPLPDSMIRRILEAGRFAPSAGNMQPWRFIVVKSPEILEQLEKDAVRIIKFFMFFLDYTRGGFMRRLLTRQLAKLYIRILPNELHPVPFGLMSQIALGKTPVFHHAPTLILLVEDKRGVSCPATDIGICGQNMVLAAHSLGAGSCWIGLIKVCMYFPKWRKKFGIKYPYRLNDCIAFGWQKPKADGIVPRETQLVEWYDRGPNDAPRIEIQGE
ncbi:MAG TPA: nitroreductase family protein [Spirochaetota bacterium]|nr:nitroreductase family protein [Spirochaetota bacterium]HPI88508.1 nitroreductase family protein [Spirochaetota bacterium]HPR47988.1 nitroreductase family protein [Spirochaetota bacterium]